MRSCIQHILLSMFIAASAMAQQPSASAPGRTEAMPEEMVGVGITPHLGASVPLDLTFTDEMGKTVTLEQYFHQGRPVILQLGYFGCPMLCGLVSKGLVDAVKDLKLRGGADYDVIFLSIDPNETHRLAYQKKQSYIKALGRPEDAPGWHMLIGTEKNIKAVTEAVGFGYKWVESSQQWSHPATLVILSPEGKVSRYLNGVLFEPGTMRLSLVEASQGKVGSTVDQLLLVCLHFDASTGKYTLAAMTLMRMGGILTVLILVAVIGTMLRREMIRRRQTPHPGGAPPAPAA